MPDFSNRLQNGQSAFTVYVPVVSLIFWNIDLLAAMPNMPKAKHVIPCQQTLPPVSL